MPHTPNAIAHAAAAAAADDASRDRTQPGWYRAWCANNPTTDPRAQVARTRTLARLTCLNRA
jgi:hypothetical protein